MPKRSSHPPPIPTDTLGPFFQSTLILPTTQFRSIEAGPLSRRRGPLLDEHKREILEELDYSAEQIKETKKKTIKVS
jgi:crotonobetainyl-CoA:carnitine CoA-transferase CaiB-like acyl-CoA transferase